MMMWSYYDLLSFRPLEQIAQFKALRKERTSITKVLLAKEIIAVST